jgi:hypothetical protein
MLRISKTTLSWGGVAIAAILFTLAVPRAAHAVVAALVQVTNTASSPVVAQGIGNQAAQIVEIECGYEPGTTVSFGCSAVPATGLMFPFQGRYTVPEGETLVVTSVDILSGSAAGSPCMSPAFGQLGVVEGPGLPTPTIRKSWIVPSGAGTAHYVYPSGILFASGATIQLSPNNICTLTLDMHGYLTPQ